MQYCDVECQYLCKGLSTLNRKVYFDKIDIDDNRLSLESLQHLVMLLVQCKTQKLYATNNIITMDNSKIAYLVMEYAFAVKAISNPLSIIVNSQERAIFCQSENNTIIKYLNSRHMISGLYYNDCHLNDEVIGLVTDLIIKYEMITNLYFWNSNISEDYLKRFLSVMPQGNHYQFVFVYEAIKDDKSIVEMMLSSFALVSFTFIFLSKPSLILFNASCSNITNLIFANPMLPETTLIETICLSQCELSDETIKLLIQLFNLCNNISTVILLNNTFSSGNLKQLMYAIKSNLLLRTIFVSHNTMTHHDINLLESEFKNIQMLLINDKELKGYNYCDKQLKHASQLQIFPSLTVLQLHYCDIKDNASNYLYKLFQHCDHLRKITIYYCLVDIHTVNKLLQQISTVTTLRKLDLRGNKLNEKSSQALASVIANNNELEELYLGNNNLQSGVIKLAKALKKLSSLKVLDLDNNNIPEEAANELSAAIRANSSLEKLWLSDNHLGSSTVMIVNALEQVTTLKELGLSDNQNRSEELAPALTSIISDNKGLLLCDNNLNDDGIAQSLCKHTRLKFINLRSNNITEKAAEALASIISNNTGLEQLYLGNNQIQLGVITMSTALRNISSLKVLDFDNNNITEEAADELSAAIRVNTSLEKLWLGGNHLGSSTVMIVNALKPIATLKELNLNGNQNRSEELAPALTSMISHNKYMERLLLSDNNLNDYGVIKIAQSLCKHTKLKIINLQSNSITEKSAEALASIISNNIGLEQLYLDNNTIQLGVIKMSTALTNISTLKELDLDNNNIPEEAANELSAAIRANNSLEKLWLGGNHLGSSTVMIVNALMQITTLNVLNLNCNQNRSEELAPALTSVISHNKSMESLLLSDNNLNDDGVIKIAQSLCKHTKLKMINLQSNNITEKAAEALASIISSNTGLEKLYLDNNTIQLGVITMSTALTNISSLKVLGLDNNNIPEEAADELSAAIRANNLIEKLWLNNNNLGSSLSVIVNACCHISSLKTFGFKNTGISVTATSDIATVIKHNSSIQLLSMSDNNLQSSGFMAFMQALKVTSSLKFLYAYGINVTSTVTEELSSVIEHNVSMEELSLGDNLLENGLMQIVESCSRLTSLKILELSHNCVSPTQVVNFASTVSKCNSLEALSMGGICLSVDENLYLNISTIYEIHVFLTDIKNTINNQKQLCIYRFYIFSELLRMIFCRALLLNHQHLNVMYQYDFIFISYQHKNKVYENKIYYKLFLQEAKQKLSQIDSKAMISSLQVTRTLKVINLENDNIDEGAAIELAGHLHCNNILEQLWLRGNELYDKGASVVLQSLHNLSTLLILDLSYNHLSSQSADGIAVVVGNNCSLQQLWLDGNELLTRGVVRIASALKKLSSLRILSLCGTRIADDAAEEISNVITNNTLLVDLLLGNNQLESKGVCTIAMAIRKLFIFRKLDLSNNHITPDAAEELAVTLSNRIALQQLFLNDNMLGTEGTIKIANALKCINTLQVLTLSNNNITDSAADVLVDVLRNNISLKILLISGNDLQTTGVNLIAQTAPKRITTLQLLDVSNNNIREDEKENIRLMFANYNNFKIIV